MKSLLSLLFVATTLLVNSSFADPWHGPTKIERLYPTSDFFAFIVSTPLESQSACDNGRRFHIARDNPNYDALVSALMLAYTMGKEITININGNDTAQCSASINRFITAL